MLRLSQETTMIKLDRCSSGTSILLPWTGAVRVVSVRESQPLVGAGLTSLNVSCLFLTVSVVFQQDFNGFPLPLLGGSRVSAMRRMIPYMMTDDMTSFCPALTQGRQDHEQTLFLP